MVNKVPYNILIYGSDGGNLLRSASQVFLIRLNASVLTKSTVLYTVTRLLGRGGCMFEFACKLLKLPVQVVLLSTSKSKSKYCRISNWVGESKAL